MSRPYFETKVVKVKEKLEDLDSEMKSMLKYYGCPPRGDFLISPRLLYRIHEKWEKEKKKKPKGNWVNGENLDKIKFPCFCSYNAGYSGVITKDGMNFYELHNIEKQADKNYLNGRTLVAKEMDLKVLIKCWHIKILKGKIIIFEEGEDE